MPFTEDTQIAANLLRNDINLEKTLFDIQNANDIELAEFALEPGKRSLPVGKISPFMIIGPYPSPFDIDEYYTDPELNKSINDICNVLDLNKEDLYLTYGVKYPKEPNTDHPMFKDGKRHIKRFLFKEILVIEPEIIFAIWDYSKSLIEKTFRIDITKGLNIYELPLRIEGKQLSFITKIFSFNDIKELESIRDEVETIKIDWKYIHLHVHNSLSFKDGIGTPDTRVAWHAEKRKSAIATSNHGNICDWITIYNGAKEYGMKPILGMEAYVNRHSKELRQALTSDSAANKSTRKLLSKETRHITLYAKSLQGFKNLVKIHNDGWVNGFYRNP
ncbi:MAG: PHP domain-containing protein, partial [bacterium]